MTVTVEASDEVEVDGIDGRWSLASSSSSSPSLLPFALASSFHSRRLLVASLDAAGRRATATVASEAAVCAMRRTARPDFFSLSSSEF